MYISRLLIRNFRNFRNVSFDFKKGVNTIIGENGSGKTNLFYAIRLLIDESMPRVTRFFETDFNRSIGEWRGHWIIIQLDFKELDLSEEAQSIAMHKIGTIDEYESSKGTYSLYFRPKAEIRRNLYNLSEDKEEKTPQQLKIELEEILSRISLNDYEAIFAGRGNIDFSNDENYLKYVGNFDSISFPNPDEEKTDIYGIRMYSISIPNEFACTFAKALRDVESDLRSYKDNPLLSLLRNKEKNISIEKKNEIEEHVKNLNTQISNLEEVQNISNGITNTIKDAVGETYAPNINIKSELPAEMEKLLQSLKLWVGDPDEDGHEGRLWELSLGGANLIYLSLKLLEFERIKRQDKIANFILIEEPEAHIHTHIQKTLFQKLNKEKTQVFISTHSTHISSVSAISSMCILGRKNQKTEVYNPANNLDKKSITKLERYLDANRTSLLFAKGVILVEGDAEYILIPELVKAVLGVSLDEIGLSIINIGSTGFENVAQLFHKERVNRNCAIITDNDISIVKLETNKEKDNDYQKSCRQSEESGKIRKKNLDAYCNTNSYIQSFYAKHTFEVDFLLSDNSHEIVETIKKEYKQQTRISQIEKLLINKDVAICGKEVLRLANNYGKGWFAIMISERINHLTNIPSYILEAIAFACPNINKRTLYTIAKYRLEKLLEHPYSDDKTDYIIILETFMGYNNHSAAIHYYKNKLKEDVLSIFIDLLDAYKIK